MGLYDRDYMKSPKQIPMRGRSAREQQLINNNALGYWRRQRRQRSLMKFLVPTFFIVSLGIIGSVYFMPQDALRDNQWASETITSANTFIDQIRTSLTPSCDTSMRNTMAADRKAEIRIAALHGEKDALFFSLAATANEIERDYYRKESIGREIDELKGKRIQYQRIIREGCIGSD